MLFTYNLLGTRCEYFLLTSNAKTVLQFDVTFPSVPCTLLSVDTMDISGEQHHDIVRTYAISSSNS